MKARYRISKEKDVTGREWWVVQRKTFLLGWVHENASTTHDIFEAMAMRFLLENGESLFHPWKATERVKEFFKLKNETSK